MSPPVHGLELHHLLLQIGGEREQVKSCVTRVSPASAPSQPGQPRAREAAPKSISSTRSVPLSSSTTTLSIRARRRRTRFSGGMFTQTYAKSRSAAPNHVWSRLAISSSAASRSRSRSLLLAADETVGSDADRLLDEHGPSIRGTSSASFDAAAEAWRSSPPALHTACRSLRLSGERREVRGDALNRRAVGGIGDAGDDELLARVCSRRSSMRSVASSLVACASATKGST